MCSDSSHATHPRPESGSSGRGKDVSPVSLERNGASGSVLCEPAIEAAGFTVRVPPARIALNLRGRPDEAAFSLALNEATGLVLPAPNRFTSNGSRLLAWLGPDEFLLLDSDADQGGPSSVERLLRELLPAATAALTCVSAGFTMMQVRGARARDVLARGWALDLHPGSFGVGHCAQSWLAKAPALLLHRGDDPAFEIVVRRSYSSYLWAWLMGAAVTD